LTVHVLRRCAVTATTRGGWPCDNFLTGSILCTALEQTAVSKCGPSSTIYKTARRCRPWQALPFQNCLPLQISQTSGQCKKGQKRGRMKNKQKSRCAALKAKAWKTTRPNKAILTKT